MILPLLLLVSLTGAATDATGTWTVHLDPDFSGYQADVTCTFKQEGRKLTGLCGDEAPLTGDVNDQQLRWTIKTGAKNENTATFTAAIDGRGRTMTGDWELTGRHGKFTAQKQ